MDRDLDPLCRLRLLGEGARPSDPRHHPVHLLVEAEPFEGRRDRRGVAGRHAGEDFVEGVGAAHLLDLLEDHGGELAVALREDRVGALREGEQQRRAAAAPALGMADHEAVALEVGEVLADRIGGHAEIGSDAFGAGVALTPEQLQDFHAGGTAGDGGGHIRTLQGW